MADDRAVLLLDVRSVVLLPGAAAGERDAVALTPRQQMTVDEFAAVVTVEPHQRHRQPLAHAMDRTPHALLVLAPDGLELDPRRRDIDGAERTEVEALRAAATVGDQIDFQEAGPGIVPLRERADGDLLPQEVAGVRGRGAASRVLRPRRREHARERWPTDLPQQFLNGRAHRQFAPDAEPLQQLGNEGMESMGPDPATGLPQHCRRGRALRAVGARAAAGPRGAPRSGRAP